MTTKAPTRSWSRRPMRCRCASATTASSRISPLPRRAASRRQSFICPESRWISTIRPISRILRASDRAHGRAYGSRDSLQTSCRNAPARGMDLILSAEPPFAVRRGSIVTIPIPAILDRAERGAPLSAREALALAECDDLGALMPVAAASRDRGHGRLVSYSRKVFIPLTQLCRDVCHYCTFAHAPRRGEPAYLDAEQVVAIARAGAKAGCREALFTLGDKPELRYGAAREALARLGHDTTLSYLAEMAELVLKETGLLPHLNPGVMTREELDRLRAVSVSQGIMLESASERLCRRGGPHFGSPGKMPGRRLDCIAPAGEAAGPLTFGIPIGLRGTRALRI